MMWCGGGEFLVLPVGSGGSGVCGCVLGRLGCWESLTSSRDLQGRRWWVFNFGSDSCLEEHKRMGVRWLKNLGNVLGNVGSEKSS